MRVLTTILCAATMAASQAPAALAAPAADPISTMKATFTVTQPTEVPGMILKPGTYSIRVLDHLADRMIVRIDDAGSKNHSTFIGLPNTTMRQVGGSGVVAWGSGPDGNAAARGFSFSGGQAVEFVYPKADAVALAKLNSSPVVAIDPASEGKVANKGLSKDDMEMVTLWTLSSTTVGSTDGAPAIKAARYKAVQVASDAVPPPPPAPRKPVIARLPHTASYLPLLALLSMLSLSGAAGMRLADSKKR